MDRRTDEQMDGRAQIHSTILQGESPIKRRFVTFKISKYLVYKFS